MKGMNCCGLFFSLILFLLPMDMDAQEKQINGTNLGESPAQAIDLGLPSGIKWASCNVGAFKVEEYGDFFAWGETIPKKNFTEENYQHFNQGEYISLTDISDTQYDVAKANWGGTWRMPTKEDFMELMKHCQYKWIMKNGVRGGLFTGHNGNSIFLPAAGLRIESTTENKKSYGCYWLATQDEQYVDFAYAMCFTSGKCFRSSHLCGYGLSIRPVTE